MNDNYDNSPAFPNSAVGHEGVHQACDDRGSR